MPDSEGDLLPGDEGYVAPEETGDTQSVGTEQPPISPAPPIVNTENGGLEHPEEVLATEVVTKEAYEKLLAAFESLLVRENLDIQVQHRYRADAGLL